MGPREGAIEKILDELVGMIEEGAEELCPTIVAEIGPIGTAARPGPEKFTIPVELELADKRSLFTNTRFEEAAEAA